MNLLVILVIVLGIALIVSSCFAISYRTNAKTNSETAATLAQNVSKLEGQLIEQSRTISALQENIKDYEERIIMISDSLPDEDTLYNRAMKLTNEIVPYIKQVDDKIMLYIFKK